jgi:hypothetical protein
MLAVALMMSRLTARSGNSGGAATRERRTAMLYSMNATTRAGPQRSGQAAALHLSRASRRRRHDPPLDQRHQLSGRLG